MATSSRTMALALLLLQLTPSIAAPTPAAAITSLYPWIQQHQVAISWPSSTLPAPSSSWSIKYVAAGLGTQNYTCSSTTATPVAAGAVANLYDATALIGTQGILGTVTSSSLPCIMDTTNNYLSLNQIGQHYFNGNGVPTFDLTKAGQGQWLSAKKVAAQSADSDACTGRDGNGAVAYLYLEQDGTGRSVGLSAVYRMATSGGNLLTCANATNGWATSDYSALYYFYG